VDDLIGQDAARKESAPNRSKKEKHRDRHT
jgi:hypothetical protein